MNKSMQRYQEVDIEETSDFQSWLFFFCLSFFNCFLAAITEASKEKLLPLTWYVIIIQLQCNYQYHSINKLISYLKNIYVEIIIFHVIITTQNCVTVFHSIQLPITSFNKWINYYRKKYELKIFF